MANAWAQRALGTWARARAKKKGALTDLPTSGYPTCAPPFFVGPGLWAQGPLWPCIGHVWAYLI